MPATAYLPLLLTHNFSTTCSCVCVCKVDSVIFTNNYWTL